MTKIKHIFLDALFSWRCILPLVIAVFFYLPVSIRIVEFKGKPLDVVPSDLIVFFFFLLYIAYLFSRRFSKTEFFIFFYIFMLCLYLFIISLCTSLEIGNLVPLFSSVKFFKTILATFVGIFISQFYTCNRFFNLSSCAVGVITVLLLGTQLFYVGNFCPRIGSVIIGLDTYGFPNSVSTYYVLFVMILCAKWYISKKRLYIVTSCVISLFIVLSLSRSAFVVLLVFFSSFFIFVSSLKKTLNMILFLFMILLCGSILFHFSGELGLIKEGVSRRINRTFSHEDPSSGRIAIAQETISLISEKPFLGYSFDSFSRYHDGHSTPHNQYLEVLFKAGLLGFFSYFFFVFVLLYFVVKNKHRSYFLNYNNIYIKSFLCVFFAISIGNLTQPNFSYSQTGNVLFAMLGFLSFCKR